MTRASPPSDSAAVDTRSRQILVDVWLDEPVTAGVIEGIIAGARAALTVLDEARWRFEPQGQTVLLVLAESHFALHTWPERDYLSFDLYSCDPALDVDAVADAVLSGLSIEHQVRRHLWRGVREAAAPSSSRGAG